MYNPVGKRGILKTTRENVKNVGEEKKRVRFNLPDGVSDQEEQSLLMLGNETSGGEHHMEESGNFNAQGSKTRDAFLKENLDVVFNKSRASWDSTVKDYEPHRSYWAKDDARGQIQEATDTPKTKEDSHEKNKKTIDTLKTLAYIKLGEEIMKQDELLKCLGKNGTETQLTKIRDGELYAFEEGGQLHITCNKTDRGMNKTMEWDQVATWIDGKNKNEKWDNQQMLDEIKWHLPRVYAIKVETKEPEPKVLITDNEELVKKSRGEGGQALVGKKIEVDFPGIMKSPARDDQSLPWQFDSQNHLQNIASDSLVTSDQHSVQNVSQDPSDLTKQINRSQDVKEKSQIRKVVS